MKLTRCLASCAILIWAQANPPCTEPGQYILWTRHNIPTVMGNIGETYPLYLTQIKRRGTVSYEGQHRIETAEQATPEEVAALRKYRENGLGSMHKDRFLSEDGVLIERESTWLKVVVRRCPEVEQTGDPFGG